MKRAPHPPDSPDLAPSDFYLFGHVKGCLAGHSFESAYALFGAVQGILEGIEKATLQAVFLDWMEKLWKYIDSNGVYLDWPKINLLERKNVTRPVSRFSATRGTPYNCVSFNFQFEICEVSRFANLLGVHADSGFPDLEGATISILISELYRDQPSA
jgi:hypothetical protein